MKLSPHDEITFIHDRTLYGSIMNFSPNSHHLKPRSLSSHWGQQSFLGNRTPGSFLKKHRELAAWFWQSSMGLYGSITTAYMTSINRDPLLHLGKHAREPVLYHAWGPKNTWVTHHNVTSRQASITPKSIFFWQNPGFLGIYHNIERRDLHPSISTWVFKIWNLKKLAVINGIWKTLGQAR